jgi:prophage tail gpP-like protein
MNLDEFSQDVYIQAYTSISDFVRLDKIESYTTHGSFLDPFDTFSITLWDPDLAKLRKLTRFWTPIRFYVANRLQFRGKVDTQEIHDDGTVTITGRSYLGAMVDAHLDPKAVSKKGTALDLAVLTGTKAVALVRARAGGFNEMRHVMTGYAFNQTPEKDFTQSLIENERWQDEEGIYEYADRLCKRHGFLVQATPYEGQITLCRPEYRQPAIYRLYRSATNQTGNNNILTGSVRRDGSRIPTYIEAMNYTQRPGDKSRKFTGKIDVFNDTAFGQIPEIKDVALQVVSGRSFPSDEDAQPDEFHVYRPLFFKDKNSKHQLETEQHLSRELAERTKESLTCTYTVQGHKDRASGFLWGYDTIVRVDDEIGGIAEDMWIEGRTFNYSKEGQQTTLTLIRPNSYVLGTSE